MSVCGFDICICVCIFVRVCFVFLCLHACVSCGRVHICVYAFVYIFAHACISACAYEFVCVRLCVSRLGESPGVAGQCGDIRMCSPPQVLVETVAVSFPGARLEGSGP